MSARSLRVHPNHIQTVQSKLQYSVFSSKQALAKELYISRTTVSHYFNGKDIDRLNFIEISEKLGLDWKEIAEVESPPEDPYYIESPIAQQCYQEILQPGCLIRIQAPWQMGKTTLMSGTLNYAERRGYRTVRLNLREAIAPELQRLDSVLQWFCISIAEALQIERSVEEHWGKSLGNAKLKCKRYLEKYCLPGQQPLVLALDELDRLFPHPAIADEVLGMLRSWHEQAKTREIWKQLRLVLVHTELYSLPIQQSPFNVGTSIKLPEWTPEQVGELVKRYELDWNQRHIEQLMAMVGGNPYQVSEACRRATAIQNPLTLPEILDNCTTENGIYGDRLRRFCQKLKDQPELSATLSHVVNADSPLALSQVINRDRALQLQDLGLVHIQGDTVVPSCELYRCYFRDRLGESPEPDVAR